MRRKDLHLPHVQSEPNLTPGIGFFDKSLLTPGSMSQTMMKCVQIKHLYKSDTDILRQLGLAMASDDEELDQSDEVEYSPDRHFKPISTPPPTPENSPSSTSDTISTVVSLSSTMEGDCDLALFSYSRSTGYQLYQGEETHDVNFIPRFR